MEKKELKKKVADLRKDKEQATKNLVEASTQGKDTSAFVKKLTDIQLELAPLERELAQVEESENWSARWDEDANVAMRDEINALEAFWSGCSSIKVNVTSSYSKGAKRTLTFTLSGEKELTDKDGKLTGKKEKKSVEFKKSYLPQITKKGEGGVQVIKYDARCLN